MMHKGKEALDMIGREYCEEGDKSKISLDGPEMRDILAYVEELEREVNGNTVADKELSDILANPEKYRLIGPSEIRNDAIEEAAKVAKERLSHLVGENIAAAIRNLKDEK